MKNKPYKLKYKYYNVKLLERIWDEKKLRTFDEEYEQAKLNTIARKHILK